MASLLRQSDDEAKSRLSPTDDDDTDNGDDESHHGIPDLDTRFTRIVADAQRKFPALQLSDLYAALLRIPYVEKPQIHSLPKLKLKHPNIPYAIAILVVSVILAILVSQPFIAYILGIRCFVPNNYLVWEATRPVSDCSYCRNVRRPLILPNMTQAEFLPYSYSLQPIIIKRAVAHWRTPELLNFTYLKNLYTRNTADLRNFHEDCQFLNFQSSFLTLENFFLMSEERAYSGRPAWYVGFSNCQSSVLSDLRSLYPIPHFLPADAEVPNTDYIFMGFDQGATMHLDYIPRLMWQAQLRGNKSWSVAPTPECNDVCVKFTFYVEPGDAVLMDTRIWYHGTKVLNGEFSLTIQSEYG